MLNLKSSRQGIHSNNACMWAVQPRKLSRSTRVNIHKVTIYYWRSKICGCHWVNQYRVILSSPDWLWLWIIRIKYWYSSLKILSIDIPRPEPGSILKRTEWVISNSVLRKYSESMIYNNMNKYQVFHKDCKYLRI